MPEVSLSRYEFAPVEVDSQGRTFLDVPDPVAKRARRDDARYVVGQGTDWWSLAWKAFLPTLDPEQDIRPTGFYDVIMQINGYVDPFAEIPLGTVLRVPSVDALIGEIRVPPAFYQRNRTT